MNAECSSLDPIVVSPEVLILCDTGASVEELVPVHLICWRVLGALVVCKDDGFASHELMLVKDRLKSADPALWGDKLSLDDPNRAADVLKERLEKLVEHAIAGTRFDDNGVYFVVFGYIRELGKHGIAITAA